jgi:hypothetical protein
MSSMKRQGRSDEPEDLRQLARAIDQAIPMLYLDEATTADLGRRLSELDGLLAQLITTGLARWTR